LRFLLYNIRYGAGVGASFHLPVPCAGYLKSSESNFARIVDFIRSVSADIVGLVEVDSGSFRAEKSCQASRLAGQLGYHYLVQTKYKEGSMATRVPVLKDQGNALLFRQPIRSHHYHFFDKGVKRLVLEAATDEVTVFLIHLSLTYRRRQHQLEQLYQMVRGVQGPLIVAGDFNLLWGEQELGLFLAATGLVSANTAGRPSHPSHAPKRQLDFILYNSGLLLQNFSIPSVKFSDHTPLLCDFTVK